MSENGNDRTREGKLITRLRDRRTIETALAHMLTTQTDEEWNQKAQHIASLGPEVLRVLTQKLNTANTAELAALGTIATYADRDLVTQALYGLLYKPDTPDVQRMGAILLLERYLGEPVPETALMSLQDPRGVVQQSLVQVLEAARESRFLLLEYLRILLEQPAEATHAVIDALAEIGGDEVIGLLRLLAQDEELAIAEHALDTLAALQTPAALQALQSLPPTLPPPLRDRTERALRKIRFRGQEVAPLPPVPQQCRALVSPVDGRGNQVLWFLRHDPVTQRDRFLSVLVSDAAGLKNTFGDDAALPDRFPQQRPPGTLHVVPAENQPLILLEAPYDYGRRLLLQGLTISFGLGLSTPLEYRLLNDLVWGYQLPSELPLRRPTVSPAQQLTLLPWLGRLLDHPALESWFVESESVYTYVERMTRWQHIDIHDPAMQRWLMNLVTEHFTPEALARYQDRLVQMSEWFLWADDEDTARLAWVAAATLPHVPPQQHPLVVRMIETGLVTAAENMQRGFDLRKTPEAFD